ncbi:MAG: lipoate--protein ligase [Cyclobacteriaceae bacterium]|nr:lipoate--protein ligase [Cyclobacteriaceae bacterium]
MKATWRYISESNASASYGLATDEFLIHTHQVENAAFPVSLRLYTYKNYAALAGRFQDIQAEINTTACMEKGYGFGRRLTGGGAIIMGEDQLGICLSTHSRNFKWEQVRELYHLFSQPILDMLRGAGVKAGFREKNDLEASGKKIAGLGIYVSPDGGIQFHSSLLLDLDIPAMLGVLNIPIQKFADKQMVERVEQRMTTIRRETGQPMEMGQLKEAVKNSYARYFDIDFTENPLSDQEKEAIRQLEETRYLTDDWIFQHSPQDDMTGMSLLKTSAGLLRTYIGLKGESIKSVLITGDFMGQGDALARIESRLKWSPLDREKITAIVRDSLESDKEQNPENLRAGEVAEAIWLAAQRAHAAQRYTYKGSCYYPQTQPT